MTDGTRARTVERKVDVEKSRIFMYDITTKIEGGLS